MPISFRCEHCSAFYRVADDTAGKAAKCKQCGKPISVPVPPEFSPGGSQVIRHSERTKPFTLAIGDDVNDDVNVEFLIDHVENQIGPIDFVYHEIISDLVHIDLLRVPPTDERPYWTFVTSGMSQTPMTVPDGAEKLQYAELMLSLPANWPLAIEAFEDEKNYWPLRLLKILARLPHEYDTWLGVGHTIPNGAPQNPTRKKQISSAAA